MAIAPLVVWSLLLGAAEVPLIQQDAWAPHAEAHLPPKPLQDRSWHVEAQARAQRLGIGRFWGLGPHSRWQAQSSYSRAHTQVAVRLGHVVGGEPQMQAAKGHRGSRRQNDVGLRLSASYDALYGSAIATLPSPKALHPRTPRVSGSTWLASMALEFRHDGVKGRPHVKSGLFAEAALGVMADLHRRESYPFGHVDVRLVRSHRPRVATAARFYGRFVASERAPFYVQSALGGGHALRGHNDGRFVDLGAWSFEVEERLHLWSSQILGHSIAWHLDPYVGIGQVFGAPRDMFCAVQPVVGLGVRTVVAPHLVTRVDIASDLTRLRGTLGLGYPF